MGTSLIKKVNSNLKVMYRKNGFLKFKKRTLFNVQYFYNWYNIDLTVNWTMDIMCMYTTGVLKRVKTTLQTPHHKVMVIYILGYDSRHHLVCSKLE